MPTRRRNDEDPEGRRPRGSRSRNTGFPLGPALAVVALIAIAYFGTQAVSLQPDSEPEQEVQGGPYVPFAGLAEESAPDPSKRAGARWVDNAPAGLADSSSVFAAARSLAAEGEQHLLSARSADANGDSSRARELRKQAHAAFNKAFEDTAMWEMEIEGQYTDRDRQVEKIKKERSRWMQKIIALHKTTGR